VEPAVEAYDRLLARFGPQHWWPAETRFEVVVGALLMQQTAWRNVEAAIGNLRWAGLLSPAGIAGASVPELRRYVGIAGLHRTKPRKLKRFCRRLMEFGGDLDAFFDRDPAAVREDLLAQEGVGPETADSILLYASDTPTFVVDAYTVRTAGRLGWIGTDGYDAVKRWFEARLPRDLRRFREYHALIVAHGKAVCRPRPRCAECPLNDMCAYHRRPRP
jgi:endonuclease-3 related protein